MDLTGQTLGQYRIMEKIGRGGMAEVYKAYQPRLERRVAIKPILPCCACLLDGYSLDVSLSSAMYVPVESQ